MPDRRAYNAEGNAPFILCVRDGVFFFFLESLKIFRNPVHVPDRVNVFTLREIRDLYALRHLSLSLYPAIRLLRKRAYISV